VSESFVAQIFKFGSVLAKALPFFLAASE